MPIDIYDKGFQNWLKGVFGLNTTRTALCKCIAGKLEDYIKDIPQSKLKQFFFCLQGNQISSLKIQSKYVRRWECKHDHCRALMERFVGIHTEQHVLKFKWKLQSSSRNDNTGNYNEDKNLTWNVIMLYMHVDRNEPAENYSSLECLDISHVIKVMRNCKLSSPDGTAEPYEEVLKSRNELMHSPSNTMNEEETRNILLWAEKLLDCLNISEETYYKEAIQFLKDLEEEDFVIRYQSEDCKQILEEVVKAKNVANELYQDIEVEKQLCKRKSKQLLDMLVQICRFGNSKRKTLEMSQTEYKLKVKNALEEKYEAIKKNKAKCDKKSEKHKELENLEQKTKQDMQDLQEVTKKTEREEMAEMIEMLNKTVETLKDEQKQTTSEENRLKTKSEKQAEEIKGLTRNLKSMEGDRGSFEKERLLSPALKRNVTPIEKGITKFKEAEGRLSFTRNVTSIEKEKSIFKETEENQLIKKTEEQVNQIEKLKEIVESMKLDRKRRETKGLLSPTLTKNVTPIEKEESIFKETEENQLIKKTEEQAYQIEKLKKNVESMKLDRKRLETKENQLMKKTEEQANQIEELKRNVKSIEFDRKRLAKEENQLMKKTEEQTNQIEELKRNVKSIELDIKRLEKEVNTNEFQRYEHEGRAYPGHKLFFCYDDGIYSLSYKSEFTVDGRKFWCVHQYMLFAIADFFKDKNTPKEILNCNNTTMLHTIERRLKEKHGRIWTFRSDEFASGGNLAKFTQNDELYRKLSRTKGMEIVFQSEGDKLWGTGLPMGHPDSLDKQKWKGQNKLGQILTSLRDEEILK